MAVDQFAVSAPLPGRVEQDQVKRRGVRRAIVWVLRNFVEMRQLAVTQFMRNFSRLRVLKIVDAIGLKRGENVKRASEKSGSTNWDCNEEIMLSRPKAVKNQARRRQEKSLPGFLEHLGAMRRCLRWLAR